MPAPLALIWQLRMRRRTHLLTRQPAHATNALFLVIVTSVASSFSPALPAQPNPGANDVRITVLDEQTNKEIPLFRVIAGVPASESIAGTFEKRTGHKVTVWQAHTLRVGVNGEYVYPAARAWDDTAYRIEADGYIPQTVRGIKDLPVKQQLVFRMTKDKRQMGRVLSPEGKPVVGAKIALALALKEAVLENGRLRDADRPLPLDPRDRWRYPLFVQTGADGRFQLPTETEPAAILVVHESGVREVEYDVWRKTPEIRLQSWGKIEGQVLWRDKPGAFEKVTLGSFRDEDQYGYPGMIYAHMDTQTDKDGRFMFEKVLPGRVQLNAFINVPDSSAPKTRRLRGPASSGVNLNARYMHVTVKAGAPTGVVLGGQGRKVVGKLVGLDSWDDVIIGFHPPAPHIGLHGDDELWKEFGLLSKSPIGPIMFRDKVPVQADGSFVMGGVLPGSYQLFAWRPERGGNVAYARVEIEAEIPGRQPAVLDLGEIKAKLPGP